MKKAIRSLILALAVVFLAGSCTKSTLNTIVISGEWEVVHILTYDGNNYSQVKETYRPSDQGMRDFYNFISGGELEYRRVQSLGNIEVKRILGSWSVDHQTLTIKFPGDTPIVYHIDTANLTDLILFRDFELASVKVHEVTTLKKF